MEESKNLVLPDPIKNLIIKQLSDCETLTENGKKCGKRFIYSLNDYLFSGENLKKVMINCTKFCLKHLSDLIINGELLLGHESKSEDKKVEPIEKRIISISNDIFKFGLYFVFNQRKKNLAYIFFEFKEDMIDDIDEFKRKFSYDAELSFRKEKYKAVFEKGIISKQWRRFIMDCFRFEKSRFMRMNIIAKSDNKALLNIKNCVLTLGNLTINSKCKISSKPDEQISITSTNKIHLD